MQSKADRVKADRKLAEAALVKLKFAVSMIDDALAHHEKFDQLTDDALGLVDIACSKLEKIKGDVA